jgi:hypothetical protein
MTRGMKVSLCLRNTSAGGSEVRECRKRCIFEINLDTIREAICVKVNIEGRSRNHCDRRKTISVTHSVCVSAALVIQHANRMRCRILPSVACPALQKFSSLYRVFGIEVHKNKCLCFSTYKLC